MKLAWKFVVSIVLMNLNNRMKKKIKEMNAHFGGFIPIIFFRIKLLHFYFPFIFYSHPTHVRICFAFFLFPLCREKERRAARCVCVWEFFIFMCNFLSFPSFRNVHREFWCHYGEFIFANVLLFSYFYFFSCSFSRCARSHFHHFNDVVFFSPSIRLAHIKDALWQCNAFEIFKYVNVIWFD